MAFHQSPWIQPFEEMGQVLPTITLGKSSRRGKTLSPRMAKIILTGFGFGPTRQSMNVYENIAHQDGDPQDSGVKVIVERVASWRDQVGRTEGSRGVVEGQHEMGAIISKTDTFTYFNWKQPEWLQLAFTLHGPGMRRHFPCMDVIWQLAGCDWLELDGCDWLRVYSCKNTLFNLRFVYMFI